MSGHDGLAGTTGLPVRRARRYDGLSPARLRILFADEPTGNPRPASPAYRRTGNVLYGCVDLLVTRST
ncbi:hypothetical protein [Kribbella lupini]|uniref:hypothetical protein n=1 Tax=Kribbella lupini TaxID=291602 RepID=UPI0031DCC305